MTALPAERNPILIDRSPDWLSAARLQAASSPARLCLAQQVQELPGRHEPYALMFFDVWEVWVAGDHERRATLDGSGNVLVIVGVRADAGHLVLSGNDLRQDEDVLEPELRFC